MKFDIVTVGSGVVDAFVDTDVHEHKREICYPVGEKIIIRKIDFMTGGGGTNTAVGFSRLGFKTGFLGKIGSGHNAGIILRVLKKENVAFLGAQARGEHTGYSIILDGKGHDRTILTYKGANNFLSFSEVNKNVFKTKFFYLSSMMERSFLTQVKIAELAYKKGIKIAYNPSSYQVKKGIKHLRHVLKNVEILVLNKEEATALAGEKNVFKRLARLGPKIVCITDGGNGSTVYNGKILYRAGIQKVKCVEMTGAGDAYACGFFAGIIKFNDIENAIQLGSTNAASVIQKVGAKEGLLTWQEALEKIKKKPVKIYKENFT